MGVLQFDPCSPLDSYCSTKTWHSEVLLLYLNIHCPMERKKSPVPKPLVWQSKETWLQWYTSSALSCDFSHILARLRYTPPPLTPNTSLPAKYIGRQVIQGERGLSRCRESQWDCWCCPSQSIAAQQYSNNNHCSLSLFFDHSHKRKQLLCAFLAAHFHSSVCWEEMFAQFQLSQG